ncbi:MAG: glycosyltransferase family 4 protein [Actinobacteria bacterium]|nr:glycosyltransferase family 4 protein [Actinomycetota bacterium]
MRILMITPRDPRSQGGVERHVTEVARRHAAVGHEVTVLCGNAGGGAPEVERRDGYEVRVLPAYPRDRDWSFVPALWREMRLADPEIVHVQSYHTLVPPAAMLRALTLKVPCVLTFHGGGHSSGLRNRVRRLQRLVQRPLFARTAKLVAVARFEIEEYGRELRLGPEHFALIPNGTDVSFGTARPDRSGPPTIASVGRLERYKGHHRVIEAFPTVLERRPEARLQIVGTGPQEAELRRLVERLGLASRVELTSVPADRPEEMAALLRRVSVFALLSEFETHPIAAVEAAAAGCRLVVADVGGTRELATSGFARPVPLDAPAAELGLVLAAELERPPRTDRPPTLSWDESADLLLDLYRSILAPRESTSRV